MKKFLITVLAIISIGSYAGELSSFSEIANAVVNGKQLTFVWTIKHCSSEINLPDIVTAIKPNAVMLIGGKRITASDNHFSLNEPSLPNKATSTFSKYNLQDNGLALLDITVMKAKNYKKVSNYQIRCELGKGLTVFD
ncbi:VirK family protein [Legionella clemsonensis]|uniref:VirK protein n=1 Tax=Legionella clemsonensis TaxID=1867846 RepID=A0A222P4V5_9GAMM|nr:VirK family protein [Legionella clemsonensis]ASQ46862.1 VirK protein [Legionella clemsonensis]